MFAALRHRDFRWLWASTFCSTSGQWIQNATLGWVTYELTGSGTLLGAVLGVRAIPGYALQRQHRTRRADDVWIAFGMGLGRTALRGLVRSRRAQKARLHGGSCNQLCWLEPGLAQARAAARFSVHYIFRYWHCFRGSYSDLCILQGIDADPSRWNDQRDCQHGQYDGRHAVATCSRLGS